MLKGMMTLVLFLSLICLANAELNVGYEFANPANKVVIDIPEVEINQSLVTVNNSIYWNGHLWDDNRWLNIDGSNANTNIDVTPYDISANKFVGDGSLLTNLPTVYPHDQDLNTTDDVKFHNMSFTYFSGKNGTMEYLNVTQDLYVKNSTIYLGNVSISSIEYPNGDKVVTFGDSFVNASGYFGDGGFLDNITFANGTVTATGFNGSNFYGGNFTGDNFTGDFYGTYDWTAEFPFLNFNGTLLTFNETRLLSFVAAIHDQELNTTSNVTFNDVTANFYGSYDWTAQTPWLSFNGTYLSFNDTYLNDYIETSISNHTFNNLTVNNLNVTGSITLNNTSITDWSTFEVKEYEDIILVNSTIGYNQSTNLLNFEITQIIVTPSISTNRYRFEAVEATNGDIIDRNRRRHTGEWNILKSHAINDKVNVTISNVLTPDVFTVRIKYIDNYRL